MSKTTHIFGLVNSIFKFATKTTVGTLKITFMPGLGLGTRLGYRAPTPEELRLLADALARANIGPAVRDIHAAAAHADALFGHAVSAIHRERFLGVFDDAQVATSDLMHATADAFEKEPVKNFVSYFRAIETARSNMAMGF